MPCTLPGGPVQHNTLRYLVPPHPQPPQPKGHAVQGGCSQGQPPVCVCVAGSPPPAAI